METVEIKDKKPQYDDVYSAADTFTEKICISIASWGTIGFIPKASGTFGSLAALPIAWALLYFGGVKLLMATCAIITVTAYITTKVSLNVTKRLKSKFSKGCDDPSFVVIDEVAGQLLTFILPAIVFKAEIPFFFLYGFLLFRLFDILKPLHVGWADKKLAGSLGVTLDDIIAGAYAGIVLTAGAGLYLLLTK